MKDVIAPTDSRWRQDIRLYEEGDETNADRIKIDYEQEQRRKRAHQETTGEVWKPKFFFERPHPFVKPGDGIKTEDPPRQWVLVEGEQGYWERRNRGDWSDMPNLWGPFEDQE